MSQNSKTNGAQSKNDENNPNTDIHDEKGYSETLLIGDGTPRWLSTRFTNIEPTMSSGEVFITVLDVLMHESGFTSSEVLNTSNSFDIKIMRSLNKRNVIFENNTYQIKYSYITKQNCTLILIEIQNLAVINIFVPDLKTVSLTLDMNKYLDLKNFPKLKNNTELSVIFKNALCEMKSSIHHDLPIQYPGHILTIPVEILICICQYLNPQSFLNFSLACKHFYYSLFDEESIWKCISRLYLPSRPVGFRYHKDFVMYQQKAAEQTRILHAMDPYLYEGYPGYYLSPPESLSIFHY